MNIFSSLWLVSIDYLSNDIAVLKVTVSGSLVILGSYGIVSE